MCPWWWPTSTQPAWRGSAPRPGGAAGERQRGPGHGVGAAACLAGLKRVEVATYQAVSGSGRGAMDELAGETVAMLSGKKARGRAFGRQIAFNVIPQVDTLEADGVSREERRLWEETRRVLGLPGLAINATAVRVPVFFGHSLAVHVSFERPIERGAGRRGLQRRGNRPHRP
jgi:aspartate-semialdehyde dehydrogenase